MNAKLGVGIIGANPERGWALAAHIPALKALDGFQIVAVSTTRQASAEQTAEKFDIPAAYGDWAALLADPAVEVVAVCVKVAHHQELVLAALAAGKHVFCEWPLGLDTAQAETMRDAATATGVVNIVGLQGRASPYLNAVRALVAEGAIGEVKSASLVSSLSNWGPRLPPAEAYRTSRDSGATGLTVPGGHTLDSLCHCLGEFSDVAAIVTTQTKTCEIVGTGKILDVTAPDQVLVCGRLANGAVVSVHVKADIGNPEGVVFQINGSDGDIRVSTRPPVGVAPVGIQRAELVVEIARGRKKPFVEVTDFAHYLDVAAAVPAGPPFYTAQLYGRLQQAIRNGKVATPNFADAVTRHRLLDAVQQASDTGQRQSFKGL
jgi:predicted dehydrogenase